MRSEPLTPAHQLYGRQKGDVHRILGVVFGPRYASNPRNADSLQLDGIIVPKDIAQRIGAESTITVYTEQGVNPHGVLDFERFGSPGDLSHMRASLVCNEPIGQLATMERIYYAAEMKPLGDVADYQIGDDTNARDRIPELMKR